MPQRTTYPPNKPALPCTLLPPDYRSATLRAPLVVWYATGTSGPGPGLDGRRLTPASVTVPAGFQTDFASVPRVFWRVFPPWGPWTPAAVAHDYLYATGILSRRQADRIFRAALALSGVGWWTRWAFYLGVRLGGWLPWRAHRRSAREHH